MRTLFLAVVAAFALGGAATAQDYPSPSPSGSPAAGPSGSPAPAAVVVHIKNFAYAPDTVTISAGQSVRFVEDDDTAHTVTASDGSFDSGNLEKGGSWVHAFTKAGTYNYVCTYHPYMKGKVVVK